LIEYSFNQIMAPRPYRLNRRAENASRTRDRIIEATVHLHDQKGVAATTYRDIAEHADVGVGTVYHHFPTYDGVIAACAGHHLAALAIPGPEIFDGVNDPARRLRLLVGALFDRYAHMAAYPRVRGEREKFTALDEGLAAIEDAFLRLVSAALRPFRCGARKRAVIEAILDYAVYARLLRSGLTRTEAIGEITNILLLTLDAKRKTR
jgi:AcrR family transcriptional regulator